MDSSLAYYSISLSAGLGSILVGILGYYELFLFV